jgi:hypothetical protein
VNSYYSGPVGVLAIRIEAPLDKNLSDDKHAIALVPKPVFLLCLLLSRLQVPVVAEGEVAPTGALCAALAVGAAEHAAALLHRPLF